MAFGMQDGQQEQGQGMSEGRGRPGNSMGNDFSKGETMLSTKQYPELRSVKQGDKISGTFEGVVKSIEGNDVSIEYKSMELQTKNLADMEYERMMGKPEKKASNNPVSDDTDADEEDM